MNPRASAVASGPWWRRLAAFIGPGYMVSVGYMDPGNWATNLAGGSQFGYLLLFVVFLSGLMAMLLQGLAARLGIATGMDLAQACRARYSKATSVSLWFLCEIAIVACDLAEVIGTAIALNLLFGIHLISGAIITAFDALLVLQLMRAGHRWLEAFIMSLMALIFACFIIQLVIVQPPVTAVLQGLIPRTRIVTDPHALYLAIGIVGATVMPHNLYLHSSIVQTRSFPRTRAGKREALRWVLMDSSTALFMAILVNGAILVTAAAVFHANGRTDVEDIRQAYHLLTPMLGGGLAALAFVIALLASGLNSTVTATLAGQIVMEGFLNLKLPVQARRLLTRGLAIVPVVAVIGLYGEGSVMKLLVFSQVVLSMQLPFALVPLVKFVSDRRLMGGLAISRATAVVAWGVACVVIVLNVKLLIDVVF